MEYKTKDTKLWDSNNDELPVTVYKNATPENILKCKTLIDQLEVAVKNKLTKDFEELRTEINKQVDERLSGLKNTIALKSELENLSANIEIVKEKSNY